MAKMDERITDRDVVCVGAAASSGVVARLELWHQPQPQPQPPQQLSQQHHYHHQSLPTLPFNITLNDSFEEQRRLLAE
ncbi:hypothetical protein EJ05DRAFT_497690 [Pseudovirgaria hyperparasitica]|uniref:Uncharacterized protein n=1 Tax=Pseudovirgaria hyperparasitica TaxID=470096 RepID=A0A6A6WIS9_9PEZI|nr:uncharacterized protein EJ05DRAFT_497690 [Pseudovirgaria hyperparasitica]KAF2761131.1 hypothetical protein EJ05DRAFT_497690 [Pseudovirgaria hyperparasitica]